MEFKRKRPGEKLDIVLEDSQEDFSGNEDSSDHVGLNEDTNESQEDPPEVQLIPLADEITLENVNSTANL